MQETNVPKIVVNDGFVDLRGKNFDDPMKPTIRQMPHNKGSSFNSSKTELRAIDRKLLNDGVYSLSRTLLNRDSKQTPLYRTSNGRKRQPTTRAISADPRFRKKRSPSPERKASVSHSAATLGSEIIYSTTMQPHSASAPSLKKDINHVGDKKANESGDENTTLSKKIVKKVDSSTMTEFHNKAVTETKTKISTNYNKSIEKTPDKEKELHPISPYWDDKRLLYKYSDLLKMSTLRRSKSTWTLPISPSKHKINVEPNHHNCCPCNNTNDTNTYKYDDGTDVGSVSFILRNHTLFDVAKKNGYLLIFFSIGSCIGILLATLLVWLVFGSTIKWLHPEQPEENKFETFQKTFKYLTGTVVYLVDTFLKKLIRMLSLQRAEVFQNHQQKVETQTWWNLFSKK